MFFDSRFEPPETSPRNTHRLLVVDDDESVLEIIKDMLIFSGFRVVAVADGKKALETIDNEQFDLVLTDLGMPGVSGWDVAREVKRKNPALPVVMLTGWGIEVEEKDLPNEGIDMLLMKPLNWTELTEGIMKLL